MEIQVKKFTPFWLAGHTDLYLEVVIGDPAATKAGSTATRFVLSKQDVVRLVDLLDYRCRDETEDTAD